jgi:hypothetical protein
LKAWWQASAALFDDDITTSESHPHTEERSGVIRRPVGKHYGEKPGLLSQHVDAAAYRGKRIRLRAFSRNAGRASPAFVFLTASRSFRAKTPIAFEERRQVIAQEWREYVIEGDVPPDGEEVSYGLALTGDGEAWIDTVSIEVVEKPQTSH